MTYSSRLLCISAACREIREALSSFWFKSHMLPWHSVTTSSLWEHGCFASRASRFAFCLVRGRGDMRRWLQPGRCGSNRAATQQKFRVVTVVAFNHFQTSQIDTHAVLDVCYTSGHGKDMKRLISGRSTTQLQIVRISLKLLDGGGQWAKQIEICPMNVQLLTFSGQISPPLSLCNFPWIRRKQRHIPKLLVALAGTSQSLPVARMDPARTGTALNTVLHHTSFPA